MELPDNTFEIFLQPGEFYFGDESLTLRTILGSCVAVVLWHPQRRIGGMCHYMLPSRPAGRPKGVPLDGRYGDEAIALLRAEIIQAKSSPSEYQAKLFGGGNMFPGSVITKGVGERNIEVARILVERLGAKIQAEHMGGHGHRNIIFCISTGDVWVRYTNTRATNSASKATS